MAERYIAEKTDDWVRAVTNFIVRSAQEALSDQNRFVLALSGGSTPRPVFEALPQVWNENGLDWDRTHIIWSDERCVPPSDPQSNYRMASETLIENIDIPNGNIHPMYCGSDPQASAAEYETILHGLYPRQSWPTIDLCLLGMGADGHTASLFPDTPALHEEVRWVVANHAPNLETWRLTLTLPAINNARSIAFLVTGKDKAETLRQVLQRIEMQAALPAQRVHPQNGRLFWFLDANAAQGLAQP
jgi:6-phosphogluconolactonase